MTTITETKICKSSHQWRINNFTKLQYSVLNPYRMNEQIIFSQTFPNDVNETGFQWQMYLRSVLPPNQPMMNPHTLNGVHLQIGLVCTRVSDHHHQVLDDYQLFRINKDGTKHTLLNVTFTVYVVNVGFETDFADFELATLMSDPQALIADHDLVFSCDVSTVRYENLSRSNFLLKPQPPSWNQFRNTDRFTDVTIVCKDGEKVRAHKVILAGASLMMHQWFCNEEHADQEFDLGDVDVKVLNAFLDWAYTGKCQIDENIAFGLLTLAEEYSCPELKVICAQKMVFYLRVENCCRYLILSNLTNMELLQFETIQFMAANYERVLETEDWNSSIMTHHQHLANRVSKALCGRHETLV